MASWIRNVFNRLWGTPARPSPREAYLAMRAITLGTPRAAKFQIATPPADAPAWGVVMDMGLPPGPATIMVLVDGSASLYMGHGGGVIGANTLDGMPLAAAEFVAAANRCMGTLRPGHDLSLPAVGHTVLHVLTENGILSGGGPESELSDDLHPLSPLFYAGHDVLGILLDYYETCERPPEPVFFTPNRP